MNSIASESGITCAAAARLQSWFAARLRAFRDAVQTGTPKQHDAVVEVIRGAAGRFGQFDERQDDEQNANDATTILVALGWLANDSSSLWSEDLDAVRTVVDGRRRSASFGLSVADMPPLSLSYLETFEPHLLEALYTDGCSQQSARPHFTDDQVKDLMSMSWALRRYLLALAAETEVSNKVEGDLGWLRIQVNRQ